MSKKSDLSGTWIKRNSQEIVAGLDDSSSLLKMDREELILFLVNSVILHIFFSSVLFSFVWLYSLGFKKTVLDCSIGLCYRDRVMQLIYLFYYYRIKRGLLIDLLQTSWGSYKFHFFRSVKNDYVLNNKVKRWFDWMKFIEIFRDMSFCCFLRKGTELGIGSFGPSGRSVYPMLQTNSWYWVVKLIRNRIGNRFFR